MLRDLHRGAILGVEEHIHTEFVLQALERGEIFRIAHAGDHAPCAHLLCQDGGKDVEFITKSASEKAIRRGDLRICEDPAFPHFCRSEGGALAEECTALLRELKAAGFSLYYLSNTNPSAFDYMTRTHEFFRYLDGGIASFKVGLLKPDPAIFKLFAKTYGKDPGQCVFVDDTPVNTAAAAACGFGTVTLRTIPSLREELMKFEEVRAALTK